MGTCHMSKMYDIMASLDVVLSNNSISHYGKCKTGVLIIILMDKCYVGDTLEIRCNIVRKLKWLNKQEY